MKKIKSYFSSVAAIFFPILLLSPTSWVLAEIETETQGSKESQSYFSARFKEGAGVELSEETKQAIQLKISEVKEESIGKTDFVSTVPVSSLLKTISGTYVYVVNGKYFLRTEVKTGRQFNEFIEVTEGLYPGDKIVTNPVNILWYAELQALRGGKACADGH